MLMLVLASQSPVNADDAPKTEKVPAPLLKALTTCGDPADCAVKTQFVMDMGMKKEVWLSSVTSPSMRTTISCGQKTGVLGNLKVGKQTPEILVCKDPASGIALTVGSKDGKYNIPRLTFVPWDAETKKFGDAIIMTTPVKDSVKIDDKGNWNGQFLPPNQFDIGYFVVGWGDPTPVAVKK